MGLIRTAIAANRALERSQEAQQAANGSGSKPPREAADAIPPLPPGITGAMVLDDARDFAASILYATDEQLDALVLACAVTHTIHSFTTLPRLLATAPQKQSGKSTLLNIVAMLANNAWDPDPTSFALRSKFNERETPTPIFDEISDVYGRSGLRSGGKDLNTILKKGYQNTAQLSLSRDGASVDVPCYCVAAAGGLRNAVPDDVWDRCIVWKCKPVPEGIDLRDSLDDDTKAFGKNHNERIHQWARGSEQEIKDAFRTFRKPHRKMRSRLRQIWGPLYAVALAAGEGWPQRCMAAFRAMALDASDVPVLSGPQMVLRDAAALFARTGAERLFAADIRDYLWSIQDVELYEKLTPRGLAQLMTDALGATTSMDIGEARARGYHAKPVLAMWKRLEAQLEPAVDDEEEEDELDSFFEVTEITQITEVTDDLASPSQSAHAVIR